MNQDRDLAFLATCKNEELRTLCDILTYNSKGEFRLDETVGTGTCPHGYL